MKSRENEAQAARLDVDLGGLAGPAMEARLDAHGLPVLAFAAEEDVHHLYAGQDGGGWRLMIASVPLPVGTFILEMDARFNSLKGKSEDLKRVVKKMPRMAKTITDFATFKGTAQNDLTTANTTFATATSTARDKLLAEEALAKALHKLIVAVNALAKRLGAYVSTPGNAHKPKASDYYSKKMSGAVERYRIEGLVARYNAQPDYPDTDFERDHQPHNDLIETMAALPEFAGKKMQTVAAGRTQLGWSIMLHHERHQLGRTYGNKGGQVTAAFNSALATHRATTPTPTAAETRQFCIDYLVQSLKDDVAAMKTVANSSASYSDLTAPVTAMVQKAAKPNVASPTDIANAITAKENEVKQQILDGEDRMLATESEVRQYDT